MDVVSLLGPNVTVISYIMVDPLRSLYANDSYKSKERTDSVNDRAGRLSPVVVRQQLLAPRIQKERDAGDGYGLFDERMVTGQQGLPLTDAAPVIQGRGNTYQVYTTNADLSAPQSGHTQLSGTLSKGVPGGIALVGSPCDGS